MAHIWGWKLGLQIFILKSLSTLKRFRNKNKDRIVLNIRIRWKRRQQRPRGAWYWQTWPIFLFEEISGSAQCQQYGVIEQQRSWTTYEKGFSETFTCAKAILSLQIQWKLNHGYSFQNGLSRKPSRLTLGVFSSLRSVCTSLTTETQGLLLLKCERLPNKNFNFRLNLHVIQKS